MITNLQRRNAAAMRAGQAAYDNAEPDCDDGREDYIDAQAEMLLTGFDADNIPFLPRGMERGFADRASEVIAAIDDHEYPVVQLLLAANNGNIELVKKLAQRFMPALCKLAENLVEEQLNEKSGY